MQPINNSSFSPISLEGIKSILKNSEAGSSSPSQKRNISFYGMVSVVLIATQEEYETAGIVNWDTAHMNLTGEELDKSHMDSMFIKFFFSKLGTHATLNSPKKDRIYIPTGKPNFPLHLPSEKRSFNEERTDFLMQELERWRTEEARKKRMIQDVNETWRIVFAEKTPEAERAASGEIG